MLEVYKAIEITLVIRLENYRIQYLAIVKLYIPIYILYTCMYIHSLNILIRTVFLIILCILHFKFVINMHKHGLIKIVCRL